ncbi:MAG: DUF4214 domain-containing protein [Actinobacteria bacterium]|nr:DUF4214 domain-containing protein [Actinomycetota bacterium]
MRTRRVAAAIAVALLCGVSAVAGVEAPAAAAPATKAATLAQQHSVLRLYKAYFLRDPSQKEIDYWAERYASRRASLPSISEFFARSSEFRNRYGSLTDAEFVELVYRNVLGRSPDAAGLQHWVNALRKGQGRGSVMLGFSESGEFQRRTGTVAPGGWGSDQLAALAALNAVRSSQKLPPLTGQSTALAKAQRWSDHMAGTGVLEHSGGGNVVDTSGLPGWCHVGENVGYGPSIEWIMGEFMKSPIHRANLLGNWTHVGVGVAKRGSHFYITQIFLRAC